jgi:glycerophosphoryl diester phosphodiesterase
MTTLNWSQFRATRHQRTRPLIVAHRGTPGLQPENTLPSFQLALAQGADVLETDLHFTRDDEIVLFHDHTVDRMTEGQGDIHNYTLAELKRLRLRAPGGQMTEARILSLVELMEATNAQTPLLLELKDPRFAQPSDAARLIDLLERYDMVQRCAIISFHADYVAGVEAVQPAIPTGNITMWNALPTGKAELLGPLWPLIYLNPLYVWWAHRLGKIVCPLDPTPEPRIRYYLRLGVDALLTNNPATTLDAIAQAQR